MGEGGGGEEVGGEGGEKGEGGGEGRFLILEKAK